MSRQSNSVSFYDESTNPSNGWNPPEVDPTDLALTHPDPDAPPKEYEVKGAGPGRFRVVHNTPGKKVVQATYFVQVTGNKITCSCPDANYRRQGRCKHCVFIAGLVGRPELATPDPDNFYR